MIDSTVWRTAMGQFATGVTIITTVDEAGRPLGMTANAFTSLSLVPPMVLICVDNNSSTLPQLTASGKYCVNILADSQEAVSRQFAQRGAIDKFAGIPYFTGLLGLPVIEGCLASVECELSEQLAGGDHMILLGHGKHIYETEAASEPLVFYRGKYRRLAELEVATS